MSKIIVITNNFHPLYSKLERIADVFLNTNDPDWESNKAFKEKHLIFDFTLNTAAEKESLFQKLNFLGQAPIISDLSCHWGDYFTKRYTIAAAHSAAFFSPTKTIEIKHFDENLKETIQLFFSKLELKLLPVDDIGIGFHYPRVISMIINEAFLASDDRLAKRKDIDRAMKYGVNYPLGPFEWAHKIGPRPIVMLLDELNRIDGSTRYHVSPQLRSDMLLGNDLNLSISEIL